MQVLELLAEVKGFCFRELLKQQIFCFDFMFNSLKVRDI